MHRILLVLLLGLGVGLLGGCAPAAEESSEASVRVATSLIPHGWLIERIGGERVEMVVTLPAGASHATFAPSDRQVSRVLGSAVYFRAGVPFERGGWFTAMETLGSPEVVDLREGVALRTMEAHTHHEEDGHDHAHDHGHHHGHAHGADDPHTWLSPVNLITQAGTVLRKLEALDPAGAEAYRANHATLVAELSALDRELVVGLAGLRGTAFFVFHPSWGYFADRYGLEQVAIEVAGQDPSDRELTELQERARAEGISVVFVQPQIAGAGAEAVAEAIGGRVEVIDPMAADVVANLRAVAAALVAAAEGGG
ncbi:metal ABC transporter solute-binding protein, Zn/Mn family [Mucisphaera sp.]|uniref:metal ABC transporter solute-binding protein, Zn/Mn family n=1 Tax=Mucisphaera sp. TaxID=2913024 RepID=UPI003D0F4BA6